MLGECVYECLLLKLPPIKDYFEVIAARMYVHCLLKKKKKILAIMLMHKWLMSTVEELWFYYLFIFNSDGRLACTALGQFA